MLSEATFQSMQCSQKGSWCWQCRSALALHLLWVAYETIRSMSFNTQMAVLLTSGAGNAPEMYYGEGLTWVAKADKVALLRSSSAH